MEDELDDGSNDSAPVTGPLASAAQTDNNGPATPDALALSKQALADTETRRKADISSATSAFDAARQAMANARQPNAEAAKWAAISAAFAKPVGIGGGFGTTMSNVAQALVSNDQQQAAAQRARQQQLAQSQMDEAKAIASINEKYGPVVAKMAASYLTASKGLHGLTNPAMASGAPATGAAVPGAAVPGVVPGLVSGSAADTSAVPGSSPDVVSGDASTLPTAAAATTEQLPPGVASLSKPLPNGLRYATMLDRSVQEFFPDGTFGKVTSKAPTVSKLETATGDVLMQKHPELTGLDPGVTYRYNGTTLAPVGAVQGQLVPLKGLTAADYSLEPDAFAAKLKSVDPLSFNRINSIATYQTLPDTSRGGLSATELAAVLALNPNYNVANAKSYQKTINDYASTARGSAGGQVLAMNVATQHLGDWYDAVTKLNKHDSGIVNSATNAIKSAQLDPDYVQANSTSNNVAGEIAAAVTGHVTDKSTAAALTGLNVNVGPKAAKVAFEANADKLLQRATQLADDLYRKTGEPVSPGAFLSKATMDTIQRISPGMLDKYNIDPSVQVSSPLKRVQTALGISGTGATLPSDPSHRIAGVIYATPKGPHRWLGTGWETP